MQQYRIRHFMAGFIWPVLDVCFRRRKLALQQCLFSFHQSVEQPTWQLCCRYLHLVRWILSLVAFSSPHVHKLRQIQSAVRVGFQISVWGVYRRLSSNLYSWKRNHQKTLTDKRTTKQKRKKNKHRLNVFNYFLSSKASRGVSYGPATAYRHHVLSFLEITHYI